MNEPFNQQKVIEDMYHWLHSNRWSDTASVKCDHVTELREELALFLGPKIPRKGRGSRIAQVDILVCNEDERTVDLIIEVDPNPNPKKLMGNVLSVLLADRHVPSNSYSTYEIKDTLIVFLTVLDGSPGSQKAAQFDLIEQAMRKKLPLSDLGAKDVILCHGPTEDEAFRNCQDVITTRFGRK